MTDIKKIVRKKYTQIAHKQTSCCGNSHPFAAPQAYTVFSESYKNLEGYNKDADLNLGCGIPTSFADIKPGYSVLDLGSGAGNDCFVARALVGESGMVTGLDFTDAMIEKAQDNNIKAGFTNVKFVKGDIEHMPLPDNSFDVIISNCVLNLVPNKNKAFAEMNRVLKTGGHFCISDVVISGQLPEALKKDADMYAGCVSGAIDKMEYLKIIEQQGFHHIEVKKEKKINLPDALLEKYLTPEAMETFKESGVGIFSITVNGYK